MKTASSPLRALIESGQFYRADLYTITLIDGTVIRTTSADISLSWGGHTFLADSPIIVRDKITVSLGFQVDVLNATLIPKSTDTVTGISWGKAVRSGVLDGATFLVEKAYLSVWPTIVGVLHGFQGNVSDIDGGRASYKLAIKSAMELLSLEMPRNLYQSTCLHNVYDPGCTLLRASFTVSGTVTGGGTLNGLTASGLAQASGYFDQGVLAFTSGPNNGLRRSVKTHLTGGVFTFALPLTSAPLVGNTFTVYPGCDRTQATCNSKFSNKAHFKGYPYVPTPETAI